MRAWIAFDGASCAVQLSSPLLFPSQRSGERALQAVEVVSARRGGEDEGLRPYTFTFCLERVEAGPFKVRGLLMLKDAKSRAEGFGSNGSRFPEFSWLPVMG